MIIIASPFLDFSGDTSTSEGGVSVGGVVGGLAVTLVLLVGVVVLRNYCRRRRGRRKQEPRPQSDDSNPDVVPNIGKCVWVGSEGCRACTVCTVYWVILCRLGAFMCTAV